MNNKNHLFRQNILSQFNRNKNINPNILLNKLGNNSKTKLVKFSNLPTTVRLSLLVSPRQSKEEMNKYKFHGKNKSKSIP